MIEAGSGSAPSAVLEISLHGPFAVTSADGTDRTPRPHKARALVALLATAADGRRSRRWIEERLWSDRAPAQAAGSLRQALVDLRKALGPEEGVLTAGREWIAFAPGTTRVRTGEGGEFLEGIAVRDPVFQRWLDGMRRRQTAASTGIGALSAAAEGAAAHAASLAPEEPIRIRFGTANVAGTGAALVAEIVASRIASDIADRVTAAILTRAPVGAAGGPCDIDITCNLVEDNGICLAFIKVIQPSSGRVIFAKDCRLIGTASSLASNEDLIRAAFEAAERTVARVPHIMGLSRPVTKSAALGQLALHRMFSFDEAQLAEADRLMEAAWEVEENPVHLAWRGLLQMVTAIERPSSGRGDLKDLADRLTHHALERDATGAGGNATIKALVAQTRAMLWGDAEEAGMAAKAALAENPRNPFALQAMAVAHMLAGDGEEAYRLSHLGRSYARQSAFRHWWDAHHATVCVATGRTTEAIAAAEAAAFAAPSLRPAYRYLMSLHAHRGDLDRAETMRAKLEALEPGFTLDRMLEDPDYPVRTLRNTGLLKHIRKLM
jgi:hypothetical protein